MAIRPTDLQGGLIQSVQTAALSARAEDAPRQAAIAAQTAFAAQLSEREETVQGAGEVQGTKVRPKSEREREQPRKRARKPGEPFEAAVDDGAAVEPAHLIDFTA
ncbi:MAG: hypothetical protein ABR591_14400 [Candidatus Velthaea sp.]